MQTPAGDWESPIPLALLHPSPSPPQDSLGSAPRAPSTVPKSFLQDELGAGRKGRGTQEKRDKFQTFVTHGLGRTWRQAWPAQQSP